MHRSVLRYAVVVAALSFYSGTAAAVDLPTQIKPGVAGPLAPPPGQVNRYIIPHYYSVISGAGRSFTAATIRNNSSVTCSAAVRFQRGFGTTDICVVNQSIPPGQSRTYCSRQPGSFGAYDCNLSCPTPLTFDAGHGFVSSTSGATCGNIAVDAEVVYTTTDVDDVITGLTRLTVSKAGAGTQGD